MAQIARKKKPPPLDRSGKRGGVGDAVFLQMDDQRPTPAVGMRTGGIETLTGT